MRPADCQMWRATGMWVASRLTTAMRPSHRKMNSPAALRAASVKCGRSAVECLSAVVCRCVIVPCATVEFSSAVKRRVTMGCADVCVDRRRAEAPGWAMRGLAAGDTGPRPCGRTSPRTGASRRRHCGNARRIEARSRARVGISSSAAMGWVMHPYIARE
jgi:hypothetical protein